MTLRALLIRYLFSGLGLLLSFSPARAAAEDTLRVHAGLNEIFLGAAYCSVLEDPTNQLTLADMLRPEWAARFRVVDGQRTGQRLGNIEHTGSAYWLRLRVRDDSHADDHWYLEMFDSHISDLTFYRPDGLGRYFPVHTGADQPFSTRPYAYKNFLLSLPLVPGQMHTYYIRLQSTSKTSFIGRLLNETTVAAHFQDEYILLGGFYGVLLLMVVYNLCLYVFIREQVYLRYVGYVLSCSLLFLSEDGLGFEYLWPRLPGLNQLIGNGAPILLLLAFSHYARYFLDIPQRRPRFDRGVRLVTWLSAGLLALDAFGWQTGRSFWLYLVPYSVLVYAAGDACHQGFRPARFFLLAHAPVAASLLFLVTRKLGIIFYANIFTVYSMNVAFVIEVTVLSYALGEKIRGIKDATLRAQTQLVKQLRQKRAVQEQLVGQLQQNQVLQQQLNSELETQVAQRTKELRRQSETIAAQNRELLQANGLLAIQSAAIEQLNRELQRDLQQAQAARVLARTIDFGEFSQIYPDKEACLRYLADLKWGAGYRCRKCGHEKHCEAREPHGRRCTRCRYVESATAYTMLQKCKFSPVKALYAVFLLHAHRGQYNSQELARVLDLRQATCWAFGQKIQEALQRRRQAADYEADESWTKLLLGTNVCCEEADVLLDE